MNSKPNDYQRLFIRLALKRLPHHFALSLASRVHFIWLIATLDRYAKKRFIGKPELLQFSETDIYHYNSLTNNTTLWHGTGRYQHSANGDIDVLESILKRGSLRPVEDAYAIFSGGKIMQSISLTKLRIIARSYADTNGKGFREPNRYGNALMWASYYYGLFYAYQYTRGYFSIRKYYKTWHSHTHDERGHNTWGKKTNRDAKYVWDIFGLGSDIKGNYPVIFGIKEIDGRIELSPIFNKYEVRTSSGIRLDQLTHIEVPSVYIAEIKGLLGKHGLTIPVESIEAGEVKASRTKFSTLLGYDIKKEA
jgi:hypothetical protein